jgi:very-short-patch-repair endonuclease
MVARLSDEAPGLGKPLARSCRPIAAERHPDGRLLTVLGCWWRSDLTELEEPVALQRLGELLGSMLEDEITTRVVAWPAGMANSPGSEAGEVPEPDLLAGVPQRSRTDADRCESALERWLFARAYSRGVQLECQYVIDHYRVDFALPRFRVAAEVLGWETHQGPRERERRLGEHRWRVLWFSGEEVHADVDGCVTTLARSLPRDAFVSGPRPSQPGPGRYGRGDRRRLS